MYVDNYPNILSHDRKYQTADPKQSRFFSFESESDRLHVMKGVFSGKVQVAEHLQYLR